MILSFFKLERDIASVSGLLFMYSMNVPRHPLGTLGAYEENTERPRSFVIKFLFC
jgi:hypothetical protein